ncbi:HK97 gp10 family phage protein [Bacillus infantis]|uniref:HK97 gp10 family phage protein n=1 Tax=Bacillus infantis TaxID=324767 RepID=UPI003CF3A69F
MEIRGLSDFERRLLALAQKELPREVPKIMRKMGSKARTHVARKARRQVKKLTGNYHKGWKRGKVFKAKEDEFVVRVYNSSPHAHLVEHGHIQKDKNGKELGFVKGKHVLEESMGEFESGEMEEMLDAWLDDLLESGKL